MSPRYVIDGDRSRLTVQAFASGLLSGIGHDPTLAAREFGGAVTFADGTENATCFLVIKADSLALTDRVSERDRWEIEETMRAKVLEVCRYPEIVFTAAKLTGAETDNGSQVELAGELALHGITRTHLVSCEVMIDDAEMRVRGESVVKQTEYGLKLVSVAGGMLKIKDEVRVTFDLAAKIATG